MKIVFRVGLKVFSTLHVILYWMSERALDCQLYCSARTGYAPF